MRARRLLRVFVAAAAMLGAVVGPLVPEAWAQYFGQNKVQYKTFRFQVLQTEHFDIYFYPEEQEAALEAGRLAERWYARLSAIFEHDLEGRQPLVLYASHADFEQTNAIQGELGEGTGGVTEPFKRRIVMPLGASLAETDHVLGHELVHAFQFDLTRRGSSEGPGVGNLPLWFVEGMAEYLSVGPVDAHTAMWLRDAVAHDKVPELEKLDDPKYFPYRWGQAFWAYVGGRFGDGVVGQLLVEAVGRDGIDGAFQKVLGLGTKELSEAWRGALQQAFAEPPEGARPAGEVGRVVVGTRGLGGDVNVGPALSPDGRRLLLYSSRGLFSVDLFVADAETGALGRPVVSTALDPHFSSLQFIDSAGSWAPDNRRIVFAAVREGRPALVLFDVDRRAIEREIPLRSLDRALTPAWSPDGRTIAFSGSRGARVDLHLYDLERNELRALTNDAYTDLQPAWSPDGTRLAFVTDRFTTDLATLAGGAYSLAVVDVATGSIARVPGFRHGKHINPQWAPDGASLYFVSDASGVSNVYRVELASGRLHRVTNVATGVTGITALAPALSMARGTGRMAMSVFDDTKYAIHRLDRVETSAVVRADEWPSPAPAAALPPRERVDDRLTALLADAKTGLPESPGSVVPYRPRLGLDYVGQPTLTAGIDPFGTYLGGGLGFYWSDMLGNHNLATAVQMGGYFGTSFADSLRNTAGAVAYQNLARRWNWGAVAQQYPYLTGEFASGFDVVDNRLVFVDQTVVWRQINREVAAVAAYPFSRARRIEVSSGIQHVSFDQQVQRDYYDPRTGAYLGSEVQRVPFDATLNLAQSSAAFVYDTAIGGPTSPLAGQRSRLEVAPTLGTIRFTNLLADYRRYFMPVRLYTIAVRGLHYGRYGSGAEDERLVPLYLGYATLVRGYDLNSFTPDECVPTAASACPVFDRLVGSRLLVGNLEFRFPLLRPFGLREGMYGPLPVEVAFFADGGVAWTASEKPSFLGGERKGVASAGVAFRVNLGGFAIGQLAIARPFQRPQKGWVFQFSLTPGF